MLSGFLYKEVYVYSFPMPVFAGFKKNNVPTTMKLKPLPTSLSDLPVFRYTRVTKDASVSNTCQQKMTYKVMSRCKGKKEYTRHITQNTIDLANWAGVAKPPTYPSDLQFPEDMLKAVLYSRKTHRARKSPRKSTRKASSPPPEAAEASPNPQPIAREWAKCASCRSIARTAAQLCACATAPWSTFATDAWREAHIALRWVGPAVGLGTYALQRLPRAHVLGEYVGELVSGGDIDTPYMLTVLDDAGAEVVFIDSLRVGEWTRFINHSCRANTYFETRRVGDGVRVVVVTDREVRSGEEVTVDYGEGYWAAMNRKGVWCVCGEVRCRFSEPVGRAKVEREQKSKRRKEAR